MNTTGNFSEIKTGLTELLQSYDLTQNQIDMLLTNNLISGLIQIMDQEPKDDSFLNLARNFTGDENLITHSKLKKATIEELSKESYFSKLIQYILDEWKNINIFSKDTKIMLFSNNSSVSADDVKMGRYIGGVAMWVAKIPSPARAVIGEALNYGEIVARVIEQDQKVWNAVDSITAEIERIAYGNWETGKDAKSPLVIDLDGDGVETTTTVNGVHFDHDGNGFAEKSGWVGKDDGLLVRDVNQNGQIDDGTELFGNNSVLSSGEKAA